MKRTASNASASPAKKLKEDVPHYHLTPSKRTDSGEIIWPAPRDQLENARRIISECAEKKQTTVLCPDKDADGLSSGIILWRTLRLLGMPEDKLHVYLLEKFENVHSDTTRKALSALKPSYLFVLDHGSRPSPPLVNDPSQTTTIVIDHHHAAPTDFPDSSEHVNACDSPPVATSALLTYEICKPLHDNVERDLAWVCALGTQGDLGTTIRWESPFPDMAATFKAHTKKKISDAIGPINAPRRTSTYDVHSAWTALLSASDTSNGDAGPGKILTDARLQAARAEINAEVERCTHTAPKFSGDATVAVFRIHSAAQVHPLIATRWANHLKSARLRFVMCANDGHQPGLVNFSCRVARCAKVRDKDQPDGGVNIIESLKGWARAHDSGDLEERMGENFARGHVQASGGIVPVKEFEDLMAAMRVGEKLVERNEDGSPKKKPPARKTVEKSPQKNTLANYFSKK